MEDAFHCNFDSVVVRVDRFWVMCPAGWVERLSGGQEGFDSFVSEDDQRSHRSEPSWERLVAAGMADPPGAVFPVPRARGKPPARQSQAPGVTTRRGGTCDDVRSQEARRPAGICAD